MVTYRECKKLGSCQPLPGFAKRDRPSEKEGATGAAETSSKKVTARVKKHKESIRKRVIIGVGRRAKSKSNSGDEGGLPLVSSLPPSVAQSQSTDGLASLSSHSV